MQNNFLRNGLVQRTAPLSDAEIGAYVDEIINRLRRFHGPAVCKLWLSKGPHSAAAG
jgi:hypothetical protein